MDSKHLLQLQRHRQVLLIHTEKRGHVLQYMEVDLLNDFWSPPNTTLDPTWLSLTISLLVRKRWETQAHWMLLSTFRCIQLKFSASTNNIGTGISKTCERYKRHLLTDFYFPQLLLLRWSYYLLFRRVSGPRFDYFPTWLYVFGTYFAMRFNVLIVQCNFQLVLCKSNLIASKYASLWLMGNRISCSDYIKTSLGWNVL